MTQTTSTRQRPLSPHLSVYRWTITMAMSTIHRLTGIALYGGTVLFTIWLLSAAISEDCFNLVNAVYGSIIGRLILFCYTWALLHHLAGGVRHFIWDMGAAMDKHTASKIAWASLIFSLAATVLVWVIAYAVR
ncbi:succinate dehydrogenase, cytochrome b556 subunit [Paenochrobactrum sp. BZR 588]|uniref:succinate dehydrogenase, cytochrome b556 subunit n=1 Tax=unclassified Paenochrobactrum TaxID=2639760 RepID=UPI003853C038